MIIAVVVYNRNIEEISFFKNNTFSSNDVLDVFIYDNSKTPQEVPYVENVNIHYVHDENNSGVSRAYNTAYKKAKELNKKTLLVLDQDSCFNINFLEKYKESYSIFKDDFLYAPVVTNHDKSKVYSPAFMNNFVGKIQNFNDFLYKNIYGLYGKSVINSGLMIPIKLFEKIGGYNEKLKLDFSDVYFIEKYKKININIILVNVYLQHSLSGDEGLDFKRESNRFKYYCSSSRELAKSLKVLVFWSPFRRLIRLTLKYRSFRFVSIFYSYYISGEKI